MNNETQLNKPWIDANGVTFSTEKLREISKTWDLATWDHFLNQTIAHPANSLREVQVSACRYNAVLEETSDSIWDTSARKFLSSHDADAIRKIIREKLSKEQQRIIKLSYWDNKTAGEIAAYLQISRASVRIQKQRSLNHLRELLQKWSPKLSINEGHDFSKTNSNQTKEQQIREVYQEDLKGSFIK